MSARVQQQLDEAMATQGWRRITIGGYWLSQNRHGTWCRTWFDSTTRQTRRVSLGTQSWEHAAALLALDTVILDGAPEAIEGTLEAVHAASAEFVRQSGVYFLFHDDELVYIGQSNHVPARLLDHEGGVHGNREKAWNRVAVLRFPPETLVEKERMLIARYRPRYNRSTDADPPAACPLRVP